MKPAISATSFEGTKSSKNAAYVDAVAQTNVRHWAVTTSAGGARCWPTWKRRKPFQIVGGMYDVATGIVEFVPEG